MALALTQVQTHPCLPQLRFVGQSPTSIPLLSQGGDAHVHTHCMKFFAWRMLESAAKSQAVVRLSTRLSARLSASLSTSLSANLGARRSAWLKRRSEATHDALGSLCLACPLASTRSRGSRSARKSPGTLRGHARHWKSLPCCLPHPRAGLGKRAAHGFSSALTSPRRVSLCFPQSGISCVRYLLAVLRRGRSSVEDCRGWGEPATI